MGNSFKYISKPYTLKELTLGSKFFKDVYSLFSSVGVYAELNSISNAQPLNSSDYEYSFNEFLNIVSLFYCEKELINSHLIYLKQKCKVNVLIDFMAIFLPVLFENEKGYVELLNFISSIEKYSNNEIKKEILSKEHRKLINKMIDLHYNELITNINTLEELTAFFDLQRLSQIEVFSSIYVNSKRISSQRLVRKNSLNRDKIFSLKNSLKEGVYKKLIEKLKAKEIIDKEHKIQPFGYGHTSLRILSAIGYSLVEMKFFKEKITAKNLCNLLSNEFQLELSTASYSAAKKTFQDKPHDANFNLVRFIKEI